jgi:hypothetical protein
LLPQDIHNDTLDLLAFPTKINSGVLGTPVEKLPPVLKARKFGGECAAMPQWPHSLTMAPPLDPGAQNHANCSSPRNAAVSLKMQGALTLSKLVTPPPCTTGWALMILNNDWMLAGDSASAKTEPNSASAVAARWAMPASTGSGLPLRICPLADNAPATSTAATAAVRSALYGVVIDPSARSRKLNQDFDFGFLDSLTYSTPGRWANL